MGDMLSFLLIFALSVASQDVSVSRSRSLISIARRYPKALAEMFDVADPVKLQKIVGMLEFLVADARNKIDEVQTEAKKVCDEYEEAQDRCNKNSCAHKAKELLRAARPKVAAASGVVEEREKALNIALPGLRKEIVDLQEIKKVLDDMEKSNSLMESSNVRKLLSDGTMPVSLLSLTAEADPQILGEVIGMLKNLIEDATTQISALQDAVLEAHRKLQEAEIELAAAKDKMDFCTRAFFTCGTETEGKHAKCLEAKENAAYTTAKNNHEIDVLKYVVNRLKEQFY